jgi:predicted alpha/beta-hydrolase family hydrolase
MEQTAKSLVAQGVAVYRFNWAYFTATPKSGSPSEDLTQELQDLNAILAVAATEPRIDAGKLSVGGKSLGSIVAWRALAGNKSLQAGLFLTPVCSRIPKGQSATLFLADENYPGVAAETRPLLFISGDRDPLCAPSVLYRFAANAAGPTRVSIVGGNHSFEAPALTGDSASEAQTRNLGSVAQIAANFLAEIAGKQEVNTNPNRRTP